MGIHYGAPAYDENYEYAGEWPSEWTPYSGWIVVPFPPRLHGWLRYDPVLDEWYWPAHATLQYERDWRETQWKDADVGLMLCAEGNAKAVGTVQDWKDYKNALRNWTEHPDFEVDSIHRPQKPTGV